MPKDSKPEEVKDAAAAAAGGELVALQNRINDLVLEIQAIATGRAKDSDEVKSLRAELTEARAELASIKSATAPKVGGTDNEDKSTHRGCGLGFFA